MATPQSLPTIQQSTETLAFLAGYFEGEGSVFMAQNILHVVISSGDKPILQKFADVFGGKVQPISAWHKVKRQVYRWRLCGRDAQIVLKALLPWLITKRPVALMGLVLNFCRRGERVQDPHEIDNRTRASKIMHLYNSRVNVLPEFEYLA